MADARVELLRQLLPQCMLADWVRLGTRLLRVLRDDRHAVRHDALLNRLLEQARASVALRERRRDSLPAIHYPPELPITSRRQDIINAIRDHPVVVVAGETGSGKTTQLPKMCLEAGLGIEAKVACTQPRRVAALSISKRIAFELGVPWGREVGCKIRFDDRSSPESYLKLMTDGILLAEIQGDPQLAEYNAIIVDEAHERSLNIDFLLGYLKGLLERRNDLKLIITSATIDTESFSRAFGNAPVIEVSGRVFPVDVIYSPLDGDSEETGEITYIDAAVNAVETIVYEDTPGDVLVFMPAERDIRETRDLLEGRVGRRCEVVPLFGRLSSSDQQRVFEVSNRRKVVVATNIAETSLTIPGIRWVIDTGLARLSRYNPRTRTKRLPIEPVAQSSANQRKGRAGRVEQGICIRLYSEEDFEERPRFTQPEIQRSNLADVILRMKAFRLGEIETFPFVNPPESAAIQSGYRLLRELGAIDAEGMLTRLGADLAHLPIDPTLGRMLLQAKSEHATAELLIIASGLSIQDPRDRPMDRKESANEAHRRFVDPKSDFLTLLNIWREFHDQWEKLKTQNQMRRFCKTNFLSYSRMREWQDLHAQLSGALQDPRLSGNDPERPSSAPSRASRDGAGYEAIHRSILAGLLGHVATLAERNTYTAIGNRRVVVFPGSALNERPVKPKKGENQARDPKKIRTSQPPWIVAGEIVETSQLFARTLAVIDPRWLVDLAAHICTRSYETPHWSARAGQVMAQEKVLLYGLEVFRRKVAYGRVDPAEATRLFIRAALVEERLLGDPDEDVEAGAPRTAGASGKPGSRLARQPDPRLAGRDEPLKGNGPERRGADPGRFSFMEHNHNVRQKIENWQTRIRTRELPNVDDALFDFYSRRIENISSVHELDRLLRDPAVAASLCVSDQDLAGGAHIDYDERAFPDSAELGGQPVALSYAYAPGEERDGVTVRLSIDLARVVSGSSVEWAVPGLRSDKVAELLRGLPKTLRRQLMPFPAKIDEIVREFEPSGRSFLADLARFITSRYGVTVTESDWRDQVLPPHLQSRLEIEGTDGKVLGAGRDLEELRSRFAKAQAEERSNVWADAARRFERFDLQGWSFGDLPERIVVSERQGMPLLGWPGLEWDERHLNLRLFQTREASLMASLKGVQGLIEIALGKEFAWLRRDLGAIAKLAPLISGWTSVDLLEEQAYTHLRAHVMQGQPLTALTRALFDEAVAESRQRMLGLGGPFVASLEKIFRSRQEILARCGKPATPVPSRTLRLSDLQSMELPVKVSPTSQLMRAELESLVPPDFLLKTPNSQLQHLPRYLKGVLIRGERAASNPPKDQERARRVVPYVQALAGFQRASVGSLEGRHRLQELRWMIEEFKVSLFAQELGTATPISEKRMDQQLERVREVWG